MDFNNKMVVGIFKDHRDGTVHYYPIVKKISKTTYMVWIWCHSSVNDISGDTFIYSSKDGILIGKVKVG